VGTKEKNLDHVSLANNIVASKRTLG
jgi:hypothetical protein